MLLGNDIYFYQSAKEGLGFDSGVIHSNTVVIDGPEPLLIDPGRDSRWALLKDLMRADGLDPSRLKTAVFTHCHSDHTTAAQLMAAENGAVFYLHPAELDFINTEQGREHLNPEAAWAKGRLKPLEAGPWRFGGRDYIVHHTPGHTPGGLCLACPDKKVLITGDLYFPGTIGAFTYPGGRASAMYESVAGLQKLAAVETVMCGHGPALIGRESVLENYELLNQEIAQKKAAGIF